MREGRHLLRPHSDLTRTQESTFVTYPSCLRNILLNFKNMHLSLSKRLKICPVRLAFLYLLLSCSLAMQAEKASERK